jgi:hypothetical protein
MIDSDDDDDDNDGGGGGGGGPSGRREKSPRRGRSVHSDSDDAEARKARARDADREDKEVFDERLMATDVSMIEGPGRRLTRPRRFFWLQRRKRYAPRSPAQPPPDDFHPSGLRNISPPRSI